MPPVKKRRRTIARFLALVAAYLPLSIAYLAYSGQLVGARLAHRHARTGGPGARSRHHAAKP